ncbi:alpha/beta hydrolase [Halobacteriales archaeon QS_1_67_19]|nr:MAG: alpha/beta hydrolase [Halobacteriales archaeon QS_1_67_19]
MPTAHNDGVAIHYEAETEALTDETVVLLGDAGYGAWQWSWQYPALSGPYEVVIPITRGTGESDATGPHDVATLAADLEAVLADHGTRRVHLVGAGLGAMVALRYALAYSRAASLALVGASPGGPRAEPIPDGVRERLVAGDDPAAIRRSLEPVAGEELLATDALVERIVAWRRAEDADPPVHRAHLDAMDAFDVSDRLYEITVPALVLHAADDRVSPIENGRLLADGLPRGEFREFPGERLFFVECSKAVNDALVAFFEAQIGD